MRSFVSSTLVLFAVASSLAQAAHAQETGAWSIESDVALVSDYRYRGVSLSNEEPAMQAEASIGHASGAYASLFLSSIEEYGHDDDGDGAKTEVDYTLGWAFSGGGFDFDVAASLYSYPDASNVDYFTFPASVSRSVDAWTLSLGYDYTPAQTELGDEDSTYAWVGADWAPDLWDLSFSSWVGREDGSWAPEGKTDWGLGVFRALGPASLGFTYIGTDSEADGSALVFELRVAP
jgi:uncharacterized protein (TIGR02001 family)